MSQRTLFSMTFFVCFFLFCFACTEISYETENSFILNEDLDRTPLSIDQNNNLSKGDKRKIYAAFVLDAYRSVFLSPAKDKKVYVEWVNILEQGSSVEGLYRGLLLSGEYLYMETKKKKAKKNTLSFFAREMARITLGIDCRKLAEGEGIIKDLQATELKRKVDSLQRKASNFNFFTLKRILSEHILDEMSKLREDREKLAFWYADLISCWASLGIDFGLEERNKKDFNFHFTWSKRNSLGRMQWEVLTRFHRVINHYERK